jgi:hypothetical protein
VQRVLRVAFGIGVLVALIAAAPAGAATHKTWHFWSKETSNLAFQADGTPVTTANATPTVGFVFAGADADYLGNHTKHGNRVVATDHISCTITQLDLTSNVLVALCFGQVALPGGMVLFDHQSVDFAKNPSVIPVTGGTGRYAGAKGTITADAYGAQSNDTDLTVDITY